MFLNPYRFPRIAVPSSDVANVQVIAVYHEHTLAAAMHDGMYNVVDDTNEDGSPGTIIGAIYVNHGRSSIKFRMLGWSTPNGLRSLNGGASVIPEGTRLWWNDGTEFTTNEVSDARINNQTIALRFGSEFQDVELQSNATMSLYAYYNTPFTSIDLHATELVVEIALANNTGNNISRKVNTGVVG